MKEAQPGGDGGWEEIEDEMEEGGGGGGKGRGRSSSSSSSSKCLLLSPLAAAVAPAGAEDGGRKRARLQSSYTGNPGEGPLPGLG